MTNVPLVILLAAGAGRRLMPLTADMPKAMIEYRGKTLIQRIIETFSAQGLDRFVTVVGHGRTKLLNHLASLEPLPKMALKYAEHYDRNQNADSLWTAISSMPLEQDVYIVNTDIVFDPAVLPPLIACPTSGLLVDERKVLTDESMKVVARHDRLLGLSKQLPLELSHGEYLGIAKVVRSDLTLLHAALTVAVQVSPVTMYYEDALQRMAFWSDIRTVWTHGAPWTEIDTPEDHAVALALPL